MAAVFEEIEIVKQKLLHELKVGMEHRIQGLVVEVDACIKWICITNEPADDWSWWLGPGRKMLSITPGLQAVRAELDKRGIGMMSHQKSKIITQQLRWFFGLRSRVGLFIHPRRLRHAAALVTPLRPTATNHGLGARCMHFCMGAAAGGTLSRPAARRGSHASGWALRAVEDFHRMGTTTSFQCAHRC